PGARPSSRSRCARRSRFPPRTSLAGSRSLRGLLHGLIGGHALVRVRLLVLDGLVRRRREVREHHARDEEGGRQDPRAAGEEIAGPTTAEHLLATGAAEGRGETAA